MAAQARRGIGKFAWPETGDHSLELEAHAQADGDQRLMAIIEREGDEYLAHCSGLL
jgi:hypothetical protein